MSAGIQPLQERAKNQADEHNRNTRTSTDLSCASTALTRRAGSRSRRSSTP